MVRFDVWCEAEGWTSAAIARRLTDAGIPTSREAVRKWRKGGAPSIDRLAWLTDFSRGRLGASSFLPEVPPCG